MAGATRPTVAERARARGTPRAGLAAARPGRRSSPQHSDRVYRLAYRLTGNPHDAEDLTQEVFVRVFRSLSTYTPGTFEGWLHRITTNLFLDQARRKPDPVRRARRRRRRHGSRAASAAPDAHVLDGAVRRRRRGRARPRCRRTSAPLSCSATSRASRTRRSRRSSTSSSAPSAPASTVGRSHAAPRAVRPAAARRRPRGGQRMTSSPFDTGVLGGRPCPRADERLTALADGELPRKRPTGSWRTSPAAPTAAPSSTPSGGPRRCSAPCRCRRRTPC